MNAALAIAALAFWVAYLLPHEHAFDASSGHDATTCAQCRLQQAPAVVPAVLRTFPIRLVQSARPAVYVAHPPRATLRLGSIAPRAPPGF